MTYLGDVRPPDEPARASTITDVARLAGVSVGTVSNYLNRPERVKLATQQRVQRAIRMLDFNPNETARRLRLGQKYPAYELPANRTPEGHSVEHPH